MSFVYLFLSRVAPLFKKKTRNTFKKQNAQVPLSLAMTLRLEGAGARRLAEVMMEEELEERGGAEAEEEEAKPLPLFFLLAAAPLPPPLLPPTPLFPPPGLPPTLTTTLARSTAGTRCSA